jgi:4-aminobutyrate aminotransferase-like enzyme
LCIADEVQTGFGRLGSAFWGFEAHGVVPDIVTLGKPIGNGFPMGAVVTTREIAAAFDNGMEFFCTGGGGPAAAAAGRAVLSVLRDMNLPANAEKMGVYLKSKLNDLALRHTLIGDVRGRGLFLGLELVRDRETLQVPSALFKFILLLTHSRTLPARP